MRQADHAVELTADFQRRIPSALLFRSRAPAGSPQTQLVRQSFSDINPRPPVGRLVARDHCGATRRIDMRDCASAQVGSRFRLGKCRRCSMMTPEDDEVRHFPRRAGGVRPRSSMASDVARHADGARPQGPPGAAACPLSTGSIAIVVLLRESSRCVHELVGSLGPSAPGQPALARAEGGRRGGRRSRGARSALSPGR